MAQIVVMESVSPRVLVRKVSRISVRGRTMASSTGNHTATIHQHPVELLQNLIRFNTTNPPVNERACIDSISRLLSETGIETKVLARDSARPNLISRVCLGEVTLRPCCFKDMSMS